MKSNILIAFFLFFTLGLMNCSKDCEVNIPACDERPYAGVCQAYFTNWFYNKKENKCEQIGYSGCGPVGFATLEECEACKCSRNPVDQ